MFDPLDGISNIDVNVSVGSIFSILRAPQDVVDSGRDVTEADFLQPGATQVAAGYAIYGPTTMLVLTRGQRRGRLHARPQPGRVHAHAPEHHGARPTRTSSPSTARNSRFWEPPVKRYVDECLAGKTGPRGKDFNMRWIASMVAEAHRILMRGGVFMYPRDTKDPAKPGRLRLLYEANPIGFMMEQAGGRASTGRQPVLGVKPTALHQRIGLVFGSKNEVERIERYHHEPATRDSRQRRCSPSAACSATETRLTSPGVAMSERHPIIAITGSSGAGTTSVTRTFENIFRREKRQRRRHRRRQLPPLRPQGDEAARMAEAEKAGNKHFSHFGPETNLFAELEQLFRDYGETGTGKRRKYLHDAEEAAPYKQEPGTFTPWEDAARRHRPAVLRRPARRRGHRPRSTSRATPTC